MMIKTDSGYLDFSGDIELERQVKLFEELDNTRGDFSYSFELQYTQNNLDQLGLPFPDNASKTVYNFINCDLLSDSGEVLYKGHLRVERINKTIPCSFFAGNTNWMNLLSDPMTDLELSAYDQDQTEANIVTRFSATSGIVFPIIDTGGVVSRSYRNLKTEDFVGCFYLKTLMKEVFQQSGLKLDGELLDDPLYNKIVVAANTRSKVEVDKNSIYVGLNVNQVIGAAPDSQGINYNLITSPYFVGESVTFVGDSSYTALTDMVVDLEATATCSGTLVFAFISSITGGGIAGGAGTQVSISARNVKMVAGETMSVTASNILGGSKTITKATFKVTPKFIYKAFGSSSVPQWTRLEFVNAVLNLFNTVTDYDPYSKTVTVDLFNKIKSKTPIDLSSYLRVIDTDYTDFISNYGKRTTLAYAESEDEDLREYNIMVSNKYGEGVIDVDNDFIEDAAPLLESDFNSPISYIHPALDCSIERIPFVEIEEDGDEQEFATVTDSGGTPRFNITDADDFFAVNDLVRIVSTDVDYNGDWVVDAVTTTYVTVRGLVFSTSATGKIVKMVHNLTTDDSVYLFVNTGSKDVDDFSNNTGVYIEDSEYTTASLAFFSLLENNTQVNTDFKQSLSFGEITDPLFYQRTLIDSYWGVVSNILNDPVKLICVGYIPEKIYKDLTPLSPVYLKTQETVNLYYINRISGYKGGSKPCEVELIKLP
jgi:hypothetical protein